MNQSILYKVSVILFSCLIFICAAQAQETEKELTAEAKTVIVVYTKTGEVIRGYLISQDANYLKLESLNFGNIVIATNQINKIVMADSNEAMADNKAEREQPIKTPSGMLYRNEQNYLLGASAFNLKEGEATLQNNILTYQYGFADNFSMGFGTSLFALLGGAGILYINPKFTYRINEHLAIKVGADALVGITIDSDVSSAAIFNTGFTVGNPDIHFTASAYYGFLSELGTTDFIYSVAGAARISRKVSIIGENFLYRFGENDYQYLALLALRLHSNKSSLDLGFAANKEISDFISVLGIPIIAFSIKI